MILVLEESVEAKIMLNVGGDYEFASGKNIDDLIESILFWINN